MKTNMPAGILPPDAPFTFSQSSLQDYLDCPRRFQLRYVQDMPWPAVDAEPLSQVEHRQQEALLFHRMVQQHYLGIPPAALAQMAATPDLARWWNHFTAAAPDLSGWRLSTEKALACRVGSHRLLCKYDLVAVRDGKALIYDWKTFARRPKNEWLAARMQTKVYSAMLVQAGAELNEARPFAPSDVSMIYWFAEFPDDPAAFQYDVQHYTRDWQFVEGLVREIADASEFPLTDDPGRCRFCTYRSLCGRGQSAGTDPDFESEHMGAGRAASGLEQAGEMQV
jgi:hypothetical protein